MKYEIGKKLLKRLSKDMSIEVEPTDENLDLLETMLLEISGEHMDIVTEGSDYDNCRDCDRRIRAY